MKNNLSNFTALFTLFILTSCYRNPHTTIAFRNNDNEVKVEYAGTLTFDHDYTRITGISHGGFLKYHNDDKKISAESDHGDQVVYELANGDKTTELNQEYKALITEAVRIIAKQQGKIK